MFLTSVPGKWILTGEHAVVRGQPALVFPLHSKSLRLSYFENAAFTQSGEVSDDREKLVAALKVAATGAQRYFLAHGIRKRNAFSFPEAKITIRSSIPLSSGLGSSASLCVALSKWCVHQKIIKEEELFHLALEMEHAFHGRSSGMDVAVALAMRPLKFRRNHSPTTLDLQWQPNFYLLDSGERSSTKDAVSQVSKLQEKNPELFATLDAKMLESVNLAETALTEENAKHGGPLLQEALVLGQECFSAWGLVSKKMLQVAHEAMQAGALAWKPTGSGNGGFLLTLWPAGFDSAKIAALAPTVIPASAPLSREN